MQDASRFRYEADLATAVKDVFRTSGSYDMARKRLPDRIEPILRKVEEEEAAAALLLMLIAMDDDDGQLTQGLLRSVPSAVARDGYPRQRAEKLSTDIVTNSVEQGVAVQDAMPDERAETIGVTEVTGAVSQGAQTARDIGGGAAGEQGFRVEFYWVTSKDDKVCPVCRPLDGKPEAFWRDKFPMGPPGHPRCRCVAEPRMVPRNRITRESFNEEDHPRGDDGKFISKGDIAAAAKDPSKLAQLVKRVTDPEERKKLSKQVGQRIKNADAGKQKAAQTRAAKAKAKVDAVKKELDDAKARQAAAAAPKADPAQAKLDAIGKKLDDKKAAIDAKYDKRIADLKAKADAVLGDDAKPETPAAKINPTVHAWAEKKFKDPEKAKNFATWFGDSKVVDEKGEPLTIYHGTASDFKAFSKTSIGEFGPAIYFTTNPEEAATYSDSARGNASPNIIPAHASLKNPFVGTADEYYKKFGTWDTPDSDDRTKAAAIAAGHDGIISKRERSIWSPTKGKVIKTGDIDTHVIAFSPSQIKSATGNRGTFDPKSNNINEAIRRFVARFR